MQCVWNPLKGLVCSQAFDTVQEQKDILDEARQLLEEAAGLKDDPAFTEDLILDEALVSVKSRIVARPWLLAFAWSRKFVLLHLHRRVTLCCWTGMIA